jgi:hypothetical protein
MRFTARCAQTSHATPCFQRDYHFGKRGRRRLRLGGDGGHISCTRSPSLIICVNRQATIYEPLLRSGAFSANLLRPEHQALSAAFSGKKAGRQSTQPSSSIITHSNRVSSNQSLRCRETEYSGQRQRGRSGLEGLGTPLRWKSPITLRPAPSV